MRMRQIALVARDLEPVIDDLRSVFELGPGFVDPGVGEFGLHNTVLPVGLTFLEVVSPRQDGTSAGRLLERRGGDGGYMVILQVEDLKAARERLDREAVRVVWQVTLDDIASVHLHPRDVGAAIVSLDQTEPWDAWRWGGPDWAAQPPSPLSLAVRGADLQSDDPIGLANRWAGVLGLEARREGPAEASIALDPGELRFLGRRDDRGDGLYGLEIEVSDAARVLENARERGLAISRDVSTGQPTLKIGGAIFRLRG